MFGLGVLGDVVAGGRCGGRVKDGKFGWKKNMGEGLMFGIIFGKEVLTFCILHFPLLGGFKWVQI